MISHLLDLLREGGVEDPGPEELADILWLAQHLLEGRSPGTEDAAETPPRAPSAEPPEATEEPTPARQDPIEGPAAVRHATLHIRGPRRPARADRLAAPVHVPAEAALPHGLALTRALRPLTRKAPSPTAFELDEEATVTRLVDEDIMVPVLRPEPARRLCLTLVVDTSPSMALWHNEVRELHQGLARLGAFRDIRRWNLSPALDGSGVEVRPHPSVGRPARHHREILDPTGNQLIVVLSDTVGSIWHDATAERLLLDWAQRSHVSLMHLLPTSLWSRSGTAPAPVSLRVPQPGAPNTRWGLALPRRFVSRRRPALAVPVVELEPGPLRGWAEMTAGSGHWTPTAALLLPHGTRGRRGEGPPSRSGAATAATGADEAILRFRRSSSPRSWQLAGLLSALSTVTLPVARVVQQAMLPGSSRSELAEVFLGGMLHRAEETADDTERGEPRFEFTPDVRDALLNAQYHSDVSRVLELLRTVAAHLEPRIGHPHTFDAALVGVGREQATVSVAGAAFAAPSAAGVTRFGHVLSPAGDERPDGIASARVLISHASRDRAWAEWAGWHVQDAGYEVVLDEWGQEPGHDLVGRLRHELERPGTRVVALFSRHYAGPDRPHFPKGLDSLTLIGDVVPIGLDDTSYPPLGRPLPTLSGVDERDARGTLLQAVRSPFGGRRPFLPSARPGRLKRAGDGGPRLPGTPPRVSNLPERDSAFTGRESELADVRVRLAHEGRVAVIALHEGAGGGRSRLAFEYAHRFSGEYDVVWWVSAENLVRIPEQLGKLARAMGVARVGTSPGAVLPALAAELRSRPRWLLVFDSADDPAVVTHIPDGPGHVLVTSRDPDLRLSIPAVSLDVLSVRASVALLRSRRPKLSHDDAVRLAESLGHLPLALEMAGALLSTMSVEVFLRGLSREVAGVPGWTPPVVAVIRQSALRLRRQDPAAADLLDACALLPAAEPFPLHACVPAGKNASRLGRALADLRARHRILKEVSEVGLARVSDGTLQLHQLTKAVLRGDLCAEERRRAAANAGRLLTSAFPSGVPDPAIRSHWPALLAHLLAVAPRDLRTSAARHAAGEACRYLYDRDETEIVLRRLRELHEGWTASLGPDHPDTLRAASHLSVVLAEAGRLEESRAVAEDTYERRRRTQGADHPRTLGAASHLADRLARLGRSERALRLTEDTYRRRRRTLGDDHPDTLRTASVLARRLIDSLRLGEARGVAEETYGRQQRVLGAEHPDTRRTESVLAALRHRAAGDGQPEA
ncbi:FxSxx-COOH system tetratricopeptide repeat protein [Streptomyces sp. NBC_01092]|uniref:FxSxx-COOH system tetratricopeptide repeat protein n=1 Tax=Streptomyces sp. NBC_01092 TaxID=2903748 RepID=UPI0038708440|nr:FxSxx-COOH system tetratricopeptide repeat protein [Streptomyces sp. NBC_01092]